MINEKFLKPYNPKEVEDKIYQRWEDSGFFNPDNCIKSGVTDKNAKAFSIVLPPPNVTGTLHMGHALMLAIQDTIIRYQRMLGKKTLWIPGTDHAAIATQTVVEKKLAKEKVNKKTKSISVEPISTPRLNDDLVAIIINSNYVLIESMKDHLLCCSESGYRPMTIIR